MPDSDSYAELGVVCDAAGGTIKLWSANATSVHLEVFHGEKLVDRRALSRDAPAIWSAQSAALSPGAKYAVQVAGPQGPEHAFDPDRRLLDPYARGLTLSEDGSWLGVALGPLEGDDFQWGGVVKPRTPLSRSVIYEAHVRGFSAQNPAVPEALRGTYAGLAHDASIDYLTDLGVTAIELLPIHAFVSERRLQRQGLSNYWGYNTLGFFSPHAAYASPAARVSGAHAVRREFAGMVRRLHEAGLEVILDVVYNHTAEEGRGGPTYSMRGIDNANYYRINSGGEYIDYTGCGNSVNFSSEVAVQLVLDSLRYWAGELGVDGFRFDLAVTLGRDANGEFNPEHPLIRGMLADPIIGSSKIIAEPWDIGNNGWRTGGFPTGFAEWNDGFRDRARTFWLTELRNEVTHGSAGTGIGSFATKLAGSADTFGADRGPLASVNFITAHDGFTLADLVSYDVKHNLGNGEQNRDGTDNNNSYNHGVEGDTDEPSILTDRRRSMRNLLGTLLLSAGVPMLTAGDELARSQRGNNNAYSRDSELTWLRWDENQQTIDLRNTVRRLIRLRAENAALRPVHYARFNETVPGASQMDWYNADGNAMTVEDWNSPTERTLQYLAASTPEGEQLNRILLIVHARQIATEVALAAHDGVTGYVLLWDSAIENPDIPANEYHPGERVSLQPDSMQLYYAR